MDLERGLTQKVKARCQRCQFLCFGLTKVPPLLFLVPDITQMCFYFLHCASFSPHSTETSKRAMHMRYLSDSPKKMLPGKYRRQMINCCGHLLRFDLLLLDTIFKSW